MDLFKRAYNLAHTVPDKLNPQKRLTEAAEGLNRAGLHQLALTNATASLVALSKILFDLEGGQFANIDPVTRRILIPVPWGAAGYKRWALRKWEGETLRAILMDRGEDDSRPMLFLYDEGQWFVSPDYDSYEAALAWIKEYGPTLEEWRPKVERRRERYKNLMTARRSTTG